MAKENDNKRLWLGIIFFVLGGIWLLDNLDIYYFDNIIPHYIFSWKTFLILLGAYFIFGRNKKGPGIVLIAIGTIFLLDDAFWWWHFNFWEIIWPALLLFLGVALMLRRGTSGSTVKSDPDYVDDMAIFGGGEKKITTQNFKGGKITAVFGGSNLDFQKADISDKSEVVLDIFVLFGGTEIIVPADWTVKLETTVIFGGLSDKRNTVINVVNNPDKTLVIKGIILFGGGELKSI